MSEPDPPVHADREADAVRQEVDLGRYARRVLAFWWVVVIFLVIGIVVGLTRSTTTKMTYQASAVVAVGQPLTPNGATVQGAPQANTALPATILKEQGTQDVATKAAGLKEGALVGHVSTQVVQSSVKSVNVTPLVTITVDGPWGKNQVAAAANALAAELVRQTSTYQASQAKLLQEQVTGLQGQIATLTAANATAMSALGKLGTTPIEQANRAIYSSIISSNNSLAYGLNADLADARGSLSLVTEIEMSTVQSPARGRVINGETKHASLVTSALLGLIIGIAAALGLAAIRRR